MKKYRLEYPWLSYPKGHVFEVGDNDGIIISFDKSNYFESLSKSQIDLLVLSGALTILKDEEVPEIPELIPEPPLNSLSNMVFDYRDKINEIIRYLKHKK